MIKTVIKCPNCKGVRGEYLGDIVESGKKTHLHKCLNCKQQLKVKYGSGLNFA